MGGRNSSEKKPSPSKPSQTLSDREQNANNSLQTPSRKLKSKRARKRRRTIRTMKREILDELKKLYEEGLVTEAVYQERVQEISEELDKKITVPVPHKKKRNTLKPPGLEDDDSDDGNPDEIDEDLKVARQVLQLQINLLRQPATPIAHQPRSDRQLMSIPLPRQQQSLNQDELEIDRELELAQQQLQSEIDRVRGRTGNNTPQEITPRHSKNSKREEDDEVMSEHLSDMGSDDGAEAAIHIHFSDDTGAPEGQVGEGVEGPYEDGVENLRAS